MNDVANPPDVEADDTDREDETLDLVPYAGEPDFEGSLHWEGVQDLGDDE